MGARKVFREYYRATLPFLQPVADFMNQVGRVLNNIKVVVGSEPKVSVTPSGIKFVIPVGGGDGGTAAADNSAFVATAIEVEDSSSGSESEGALCEVRILSGTVQGIFGPLQVIPTTFYYPTGNEPSKFQDYVPEAGDEKVREQVRDGEVFWLEYDPEEETWSLEHGDEEDVPSDASVSAEDTVRYFAVIPLFRVRLSEPTHGVVQYHFGSVYVPTAQNVVDVQTLDEDESSSGS